ncbi:MAG: BON domain-containing protein [Acidobacteriota bacterium]|nr:BON domain-containing protein [Acidobacteriota bacterium]
MRSRYDLSLAGALVAVLALAPGCAASKTGVTSAATSQQFADVELVARVKTALLNDTQVGERRIDVHAANGAVTLSGRVASAAERDRAVELARAVTGVRGVTSRLDVKP